VALGIAGGVNPIQGRTRLEENWYDYQGRCDFQPSSERHDCAITVT